MKRFFVVLCGILLLHFSSAQDLSIGAKGAFNSTWLFNSNISDKGDIADYRATFGTTFGLSFLYYFTPDMGLSLDVLYAVNHQKYEGFKVDTVVAYAVEEELKFLDVPVLFHLSSEGGPYLEIGPQLSFLMGGNEHLNWQTLANPYGTTTDVDYKDEYNSINLAAIIGFGYDVEVSDNLFINVGLRFGYGLTDVTKELPQSEVSDAGSFATFFDYRHSKLTEHAHYNKEHEYDYRKTTRAFGGLQLGIIFKPN